MNFIDYSQYAAWWTCSHLWYERYVNQRVPRREPGRQRDDKMAIGSMVHNGLENWTKHSRPEVDEATLAEINPTREAYILAMSLVQEYVKRYPTEEWEIHRTEEPVLFPLGLEDDELLGLAKLDAYFFNPTQCDIESGEGSILSLQPGWWAREYKTKDAGVKRGNYAKGWATNMQADFQLLALKARTGEWPQGVLISVLEKPRMYVPRRKCQGCGETIELGLYIVCPDGEYSCPRCGVKQKLKPYEPKVAHQPEFYRLVVTRTPERLETSRKEIAQVALRMEAMRQGGLGSELPNRQRCVDPIFGECDYMKNHLYNTPTAEDPEMEDREALRYVGLEAIAA